MQIAGRSAFAFVGLAAYVALFRRNDAAAALRPGGLLAVVFMAIANGCFILALNHATVAHVLFFQALSPFAAAIFGATFLGEKLDRATSIAMLVALAGVAVMIGGPGGGSGLGDGLSLLTALAFSVVIVLARRDRGASTAAAICLSQLLLVVCVGPFVGLSDIPAQDFGWLALLGVGQVALGTMFFALAARAVPAGTLALILLLEIVLGPLWTWIALAEQPSTATVIGGVMVIAAVAGQVTMRQHGILSSRVRSSTVD
jgi:drug/metabolite transporter (DMT)-like permease